MLLRKLLIILLVNFYYYSFSFATHKEESDEDGYRVAWVKSLSFQNSDLPDAVIDHLFNNHLSMLEQERCYSKYIDDVYEKESENTKKTARGRNILLCKFSFIDENNHIETFDLKHNWCWFYDKERDKERAQQKKGNLWENWDNVFLSSMAKLFEDFCTETGIAEIAKNNVLRSLKSVEKLNSGEINCFKNFYDFSNSIITIKNNLSTFCRGEHLSFYTNGQPHGREDKHRLDSERVVFNLLHTLVDPNDLDAIDEIINKNIDIRKRILSKNTKYIFFQLHSKNDICRYCLMYFNEKSRPKIKETLEGKNTFFVPIVSSSQPYETRDRDCIYYSRCIGCVCEESIPIDGYKIFCDNLQSPIIHLPFDEIFRHAISLKNFDLVKKFLDHRIDVTVPNKYRQSALHIAAEHSSQLHNMLVHYLKTTERKNWYKGFFKEDRFGKTSLQIAIQKGDSSFIQHFTSVENPDVQYRLGLMYQDGNKGFQYDIDEAINLFKKAADQNHTSAVIALETALELASFLQSFNFKAL